MAQLVCHLCGEPVLFEEPIPRESTCAKCGADLRCCRNCRHWNPTYNNQCTEPMADREMDKLRRNFCEYFFYSREPFGAAAGGPGDRAAEARAKLEAMFGGAKPADAPAPGDATAPPGARPTRADEARASLERLFEKRGGGGE